MCGIAGFTGPHNRTALELMTEGLHHRGPDAAGYWEGADVSLGMRRLAIIDVETGQQPVFNEDGTIAVVFNGEIYNYIELREALQRAGHRFSTDHSDTEVLVHLYEDHGLAFLHQLNGMFAIALWDARRRQLVLARDRLGIKPLYFARIPGGVALTAQRRTRGMLRQPNRAPSLVERRVRSVRRLGRTRGGRSDPCFARRQRSAADALRCTVRRLPLRWSRFV